MAPPVTTCTDKNIPSMTAFYYKVARYRWERNFKMKSALVLFVLALSFLESEQLPSGVLRCLGCTSSDRNAYENLFKSKKKVMVALQPDCSERMVDGFTDLLDDTRRFCPSSPCNTGVPDRKPGYKETIFVYIRPPHTESVISPRPGPSGRAFYLRQDENKNTYMILDAAQAHWFFTTNLGGCDMFVATHPTYPQKPLLIHANRNAAGGTEVADYENNFNLKQASSETVIRRNAGYVLRARLHPLRDGLDSYWRTYDTTHPSISRRAYYQPGRELQPYTFFGLYNPDTGSWTFNYKGVVDGIVDELPLTP